MIILTDIEGTTSSISFVHDVLFPYARERLADFVAAHGGEPQVRGHLDAVRAEAGMALDEEGVVRQLVRWIDEDRKITPLKALQGMIWEEGFARGDFSAHVYPDAVENLRRWKAQGLALYVYSSGSIHAQRLFFGHSDFGDLTPLFSGYFDTTIGGKKEADSYRRIAAAVGAAPAEILFLSDIREELDAARAAGMTTAWLVRDTAPDPHASHPQFLNFDGIAAARDA